MKQLFWWCLVIISVFISTQLMGQLDPYPGMFIYSVDSSAYVKVSPRFRVLFQGELLDDQSIQTDVYTPLARLDLRGKAFDRWSYFIQAIFAPHEIQRAGNDLEGIGAKAMLDGFLEYHISGKTRISFGQEFMPGNWEGMNGLINTTFTNRSIVSRTFWLSRDIGIMFKHYDEIMDIPFRFYLSVAKGEGRNVLSKNIGGFMYTARLSLALLGQPEGAYTYMYSDISRKEEHRLWVSFAFSTNQNAVRTSGNTGAVLRNDDQELIQTNVNKLFIDATYKYRGWAFLYGYSMQRSPDFADIYNNGNGNVLQGSYLWSNGFEIAAQYASVVNRRFSPLPDREQLSLGVNKYFRNQALKWTSEIEVPFGDDNPVAFRTMLQLIL